MSTFGQILRASLIAPLALAIAACGSDAEVSDPLNSDPIAPIAAPEGTSWLEQVSQTENGGYVVGNPDAPIKLIEYASFTCNACALFAQTGSTPLKEDYVSTGVVSYELRHLIRDPLDLTIATLTRCSADEAFHPLADQAWGAFDQTMTLAQQNWGAIQGAAQDQNFPAIAEMAGLLQFFSERGVSEDQALACLSDTESIIALADSSDAVAADAGVSSTPTFFLNGTMLQERQWPGLEPVLKRAGARSE